MRRTRTSDPKPPFAITGSRGVCGLFRAVDSSHGSEAVTPITFG